MGGALLVLAIRKRGAIGLAHASLFYLVMPATRPPRRCSYVVTFDARPRSVAELRQFADYLALVASAGCEVVVLDAATGEELEANRRVLRWVARHVAVDQVPGRDPVQAACDLATADKIVIASAEVRYTTAQLLAISALLEHHEVVEPQVYYRPMPWWRGLDGARMLVHRAVEPDTGAAPTLAFRASVRWLDADERSIFPAEQMFIRCEPPRLRDWARARARDNAADFANTRNVTFFALLLPLTIVLGFLGGMQLAGAFAASIGFSAVLLAARGRIGAAAFFPILTCAYAPLWLLDRAVMVYWHLAQSLRAGAAVTASDAARGVAEPLDEQLAHRD